VSAAHHPRFPRISREMLHRTPGPVDSRARPAPAVHMYLATTTNVRLSKNPLGEACP